MLQAMRDGAQSRLVKFVLFGILILAGLGLVLSDVGGFFRGGVAPSVAFEVDGDAYSTVELDRRVSQILRNQGLSLEQGLRLGVVNQVIKMEIDRRLLEKEGRTLGLRISDTVVAKDTQKMLDSFINTFGDEGVSKEAFFRQFLRNMGISEQQYVFAKKQEITSSLLTNALTKTNLTPNAISKFLNAYENEKRVAKTHYIAPEVIATPDEKTLQSFFAANSERYRVPEFRRFTVASLKYEAVRDEVDVSEERLKQEYEARLEAYTQPESRLMTQAFADEEETAQKIYELAKKAGDLQKAAREVTGDDFNFIESSEFTKAELPKDFAETIFSAKLNEITAPFKTDLGWYIVKVEKIIPPKTKTFNEIKTELQKELQDIEAANAIYRIADLFEDTVAGGATLREAAKEVNIPFVEYDFVNARGRTEDKKPGFTGVSSVLKAAFDTFEGETSHMIEERNGDIYFVFVDEIKPSFIPPLSDIKKEAERDYIQDTQIKRSRAEAEKIIAALQDGNKDISFTTHKAVGRDETAEDLDEIAVAALFQIERKGDYTSVPYANGHWIIGLKDVSLSLQEQDTENKSTLNVEFRNDILDQYFNALKKKTKVRVNENVIENTFRSRIEF